jgi:hypothetical protein
MLLLDQSYQKVGTQWLNPSQSPLASFKLKPFLVLVLKILGRMKIEVRVNHRDLSHGPRFCRIRISAFSLA